MRFGAFVVTFNRPAILKATLQRLLSQTRPPDSILVVDNGNLRETRDIVENLGLSYHSLEQNLGPAGASAIALSMLVQDGYDWIYWGDDDNPPQLPDTLERVLDVARKSAPDVAGVGAVGARFDWSTGESRRLPDDALHGILDVDTIGGNSHLILRSSAVQAVGLPDQRLFFGYYEPEYCLRIRRAGFRLLVDGELMRKYREINGRLNLKLKKRYVSNYSYHFVWRRYYRSRNYIFMMRTTFQRPDLARRELMKSVGRIFFSWRRGPHYAAQFTRLQFRALLDGYSGRMGKTISPVTKLSTKDVLLTR